MNRAILLSIFILQTILFACIPVAPAQSPTRAAGSSTPCPTRTAVSQAASPTAISDAGTVQPGAGTAPAGQAGQGTGSGTPGPGQIATSRAMTDQSNRTGPAPDQQITEIPADTQPLGPGTQAPGTTDSSVVTQTPSGNPSGTPYLSDQPYPNETTAATPCP